MTCAPTADWATGMLLANSSYSGYIFGLMGAPCWRRPVLWRGVSEEDRGKMKLVRFEVSGCVLPNTLLVANTAQGEDPADFAGKAFGC